MVECKIKRLMPEIKCEFCETRTCEGATPLRATLVTKSEEPDASKDFRPKMTPEEVERHNAKIAAKNLSTTPQYRVDHVRVLISRDD